MSSTAARERSARALRQLDRLVPDPHPRRHARAPDRLAPLSPAEPAPGELTIALAGPDELPAALSKLRDLGVAFAADSHGWAPAAIFEELRRQGLLACRFTEVVFGFRNTARTRTR